MKILELFGRGRPVISFEFFPPKSEAAERQLSKALQKLRALEPSYVSVTYGAGGTTRGRTVDLVCEIKRDLQLEAMAHLTCVGSRREEIDTVLRRLSEGGVENVLALRGDPPEGQRTFEATAGGFRFASELTAHIREGFDLCIAGACYPEGHVECEDPELGLEHLQAKVDAGAEFLVTQLFFDPAIYFDFVARARQRGIDQPIVPGIMPVTNVDQVERFTSMCGASIPDELKQNLQAVREDKEAVRELGISHAVEQCAVLLDGGAPGIHFYTLNRSPATRAIFDRLRKRGLV